LLKFASPQYVMPARQGSSGNLRKRDGARL
jgi:hypothetical protein